MHLYEEFAVYGEEIVDKKYVNHVQPRKPIVI